MFSPDADGIHRAPLKENGVNACRDTDCGTKEAAVHLGRTLPSLLDEGCEFDDMLPATINDHITHGQWQSWTLAELRQTAEDIALGLQQHQNLQDSQKEAFGEETLYPRAALWMDSNATFVMADVGCLLAQFITVPVSPEQPLKTTEYILKETAAKVLFVSKAKQIEPLLPKIPSLSKLRLIVVVEPSSPDSKEGLEELRWSLPETIEIVSLVELVQQAKWTPARAQSLRAALSPTDVATIVYTLTGSGQFLGAMITHENLAGSALAAFSTLPCLRKGANEVALSFLPLHHIFARGFVYGALSYGQSLYFSTPRLVMRHLRELKPTVFYTVPRLLEKVYEGWLSAPKKLKGAFSKPKKIAWAWAWKLAQTYQLNHPQSPQYRLQLALARRSVLRPLRNLFGGRLACFITGGAALPAEVMTLLSAAGLNICQGYGLTEASSTLSFTRRQWSRAGTVGVPMPGVELALAPDGEVMVRSPYVMQGYYQHPEETRAALEPNGWLHTGDLGKFSTDGLLTLTGYKKNLFKLSIGEYVAPVSVERSLKRSPLIKDALVVGPGRKFCGVLIFPDVEALTAQLTLSPLDLSRSFEPLMSQPQVVTAYQALVDYVNKDLPFWSTVKRFQLVSAGIADERLALFRQASRAELYLAFAEEIEQLYQSSSTTRTIPQATTAKTQSMPEAPILSSTEGRLHHV
ncbi:MAG: AMP-binding protein [Cyanobacteria bacterium J06621_3]